ncbi:hypothetical protein J3R83DRAFT_6560 [Lanmaoa asiatica]|nr:hypothetical protein J3R83DRAFT_6560 [Lanmaoa asiatica]
MSHPVPKAVLYYDPASVWSRAVLLTLREKGYGKDEVDLRVVDTTKGEELSPAFLRLNPKGERLFRYETPLWVTLKLDSRPSLIPSLYAGTGRISGQVSFRYVALEFNIHRTITITVSRDTPELLRHFNSRDSQSLHALAATLVPVLNARREVLATYLADCERGVIKMSDKTKAFWNEQKHEIEILLQQFATNSGEHTEKYFTTAKQTWEHAIPDALAKVNKEIIGPYILGEIPYCSQYTEL